MSIIEIQIFENDNGKYDIDYFGFGSNPLCWQNITDVTEDQVEQITKAVISIGGDGK